MDVKKHVNSYKYESPIILVERSNIFLCKSCSRASLYRNDIKKHEARCNHSNQDMHLTEFKVPAVPPQRNVKNKKNIDSKLTVKQETGDDNKMADIVPITPNKSLKQELDKIRNSSKITLTTEMTCGQCPKSFKTLKGMTNHLQDHLDPSFQCSLCQKMYSSAANLNKHVKNSHTAWRRVCCDICHKEVKNNTNLEIHLRTHTGERPFHCKQCGKRFTQAAALYTHNKIHLGIKKHVCSYCSRAFTEYNNMKTHEKIHANERSSECKYCNKGFNDPSALKRHIRIHTGSKIYECQQCPMKFSDASGLIAHRNRHNGIKNFSCTFCAKKFLTRTDKHNHETISHTYVKKFECDLCKKRFALKQYLKVHLSRH